MRADQKIADSEIVNEAERLLALDQPSLRALSRILRNKELWPEGFVWNYARCRTCAIGMAANLWGREMGVSPLSLDFYKMAKVAAGLMVDLDSYAHIFMGKASWNADRPADWRGDLSMSEVTPEMVADQIDAYLATK